MKVAKVILNSKLPGSIDVESESYSRSVTTRTPPESESYFECKSDS